MKIRQIDFYYEIYFKVFFLFLLLLSKYVMTLINLYRTRRGKKKYSKTKIQQKKILIVLVTLFVGLGLSYDDYFTYKHIANQTKTTTLKSYQQQSSEISKN